MHAIYSMAVGVEVWLDEAANDSDAAMDFVRNWAELDRDGSLTPEFTEWFERTSHCWEALILLLQRPWWRRVWVVQEALQESVTIICGTKRLDFRAFPRLCETFSHLPLSLPNWNFPEERLQTHIHLMEALNSSVRIFSELPVERVHGVDRPSLFAALIMYRVCEATDPRDKIYALPGLLGDDAWEDKNAFPPNYNISIQELYKKVALYYISSGNLRGVLEICQQPSQIHGLPSWVPDWSASNAVQRACISAFDILSHPQDKFAACGDLQQVLSASFDEPTLVLKGTLISQVKGMTSFSLSQEQDHLAILVEGFLLILNRDIRQRIYSADLGQSLDILKSQHKDQLSQPYITSGTKVEALERTMFAKTKGSSEAKLTGVYPIHEQIFKSDDRSQMLRSRSLLLGRRLGMSLDGYIGAFPQETKENDWICVFLGVPVPFIVREHGEGFTLVGDCYVSGLMDGEAVKRVEEGSLQITTICLV